MSHRVSSKVKQKSYSAQVKKASGGSKHPVAKATVKPTLKSPLKANAKVGKKVGGKVRYTLENRDLARSVAKGKTSRMKRESYRQARRVEEMAGKGGSLKEGIQSMAMMAQPSEEIRAKLDAMDPAKLEAMYAGNENIFEQYYSYNDIEYVEGYGYVVGESKQDDIEFFVSEYERLYGPLEI